MNKDQPKWSCLGTAIFIGVVSIVTSILGNLIAGWIQIEILKNTFTTSLVIILIVLTLFAIGLGAWLDSAYQPTQKRKTSRSKANSTDSRWTDIVNIFSKVSGRGKGIDVSSIFQLGSKIDIRTDDKKEDSVK